MRRSSALVAVALFGGLAAASPAAAAELHEAVREALDAGRPAAALVLLRQADADDPQLRLLRAEARLRAGRHELASGELGDPQALAALPVALHGRWWQLHGEWLCADAGAAEQWMAAATAFGNALQLGGTGVAVDRCLLLIAECAQRAGRESLARLAAERLWRSWRRGRLHLAAGLLLLQLPPEHDARAQRELLTELWLQEGLREDERLLVAERLAGLLLDEGRAGAALSGIEEALGQLPAEWHGDLPVLRIQALARLDPAAAQAARERLPEDLAGDPRLHDLPRVDSGGVADPVLRARGLLRLGREAEALVLLEASAAGDAAAYAMLVQHWPEQASPVLGARVADEPLGLLIRCSVAQQGGEPERARDLAGRLVELPPATELARLPSAMVERMYFLAAQSLPPDTPLADSMLVWLRERPGRGLEIGMAWAIEARRLHVADQLSESAEAWRRAVEALPVSHPWHAVAARASVRDLLYALAPGRRAVTADEPDPRLEQACRLLSPAAWAGEEERHHRCRFLLAQALAQAGRTAEAERCLDSLAAHADAEQAARLARFRGRLREH